MNPNTVCRKCIAEQQLTETENQLAGYWQESERTDCLDLASIDTALQLVIEAWAHLNPATKQVLVGLCQQSVQLAIS